MDSQQTLYFALNSLREGNTDDAAQHLRDLQRWILDGGALPRVSTITIGESETADPVEYLAVAGPAV